MNMVQVKVGEPPRQWSLPLALAAALLLTSIPAVSTAGVTVEGPIPGAVPGDRNAKLLEETYPFFSTPDDLAANGYVEEEFYLAGEADAYATDGSKLADDVPYRTRIIVRRPAAPAAFNGTVLMEWQNVTAGYDLDALWDGEHVMRAGYAWVGVSAQRVGVNHLRDWSPTRYGSLDVTAAGAYATDELSYEIFAQAARAVRSPDGVDPMGGLPVQKVLAIGASQSAGRMTVYYNNILPQIDEPVFDGYAFIVGSAPSREGSEPVFQVLSETDVRTSLNRRPDSEVYRRWEVAGAAHSGYDGQVYRRPLSERDLGGVTEYNCSNPPFSRVPLRHVIRAAYDHLSHWVDGVLPPSAPYLEFTGPFTMARNELGLALGGIQLSQVAVPTALNIGTNSGERFCFLFGTHMPFDDAQLAALYRNHGSYVAAVAQVNEGNVAAGYILQPDAEANVREAAGSTVGKRR
jgi:hypothetical protein